MRSKRGLSEELEFTSSLSNSAISSSRSPLQLSCSISFSVSTPQMIFQLLQLTRAVIKSGHSSHCSRTDFLKRNTWKMFLFMVALHVVNVSLTSRIWALASLVTPHGWLSRAWPHPHQLALRERLLPHRKGRLGFSPSYLEPSLTAHLLTCLYSPGEVLLWLFLFALSLWYHDPILGYYLQNTQFRRFIDS